MLSRRIVFPRFKAVDHLTENVEFPWVFEWARPVTSLSEISLLLLWKVCDAVGGVVPLARRLRDRTVLDVYLGALLPQSRLRTQVTRLRNEANYRKRDTGSDVGFGLEPDQPIAEWQPWLEPFKDRFMRLHFQMYLKVTSRTDLRNMRVLEVGCGRGDGAAFLAWAREPQRLFGIDLHQTQVALAVARHRSNPRLLFQRADAARLPFATGSFDVVINVESSHSYPLFESFCAEVFRTLKPGGTFCFADLRRAVPWQTVEAGLSRSFGDAGFIVSHHEDITRNAWLSLDELRASMGSEFTGELRSLLHNFAARNFEYHWFVMSKPAEADASRAR